MQSEKFLRLPEVRDMTTLSRSEIYRQIRAGQFPKQHRLSHKRAVWRQSEVLAWMDRSVQAN